MSDSTGDVGHATEIARAVCDVLPGDVTAALVGVLLSEDADASNSDIARLLKKDPATVRRARKRLADVDLLRAYTSVAGVSARGAERASVPDVGVSARSRGGARAGERSSRDSLFPSGTPTAEADASIGATRRVFVEKSPPPATPFPGVLSIVRKLIAAGWSVDDVVAACVDSPTISIGWCESWLNKHRKRSQQRVPDAQRRAGQTRKVQL